MPGRASCRCPLPGIPLTWPSWPRWTSSSPPRTAWPWPPTAWHWTQQVQQVRHPRSARAEESPQRKGKSSGCYPRSAAFPGSSASCGPHPLLTSAAQAGGDPVIYLVSAPWGSYALIARPSAGEPAVDVIPVPEVTSTSIAHLITVSPTGAPGFFLAQAAKGAARPWLLRAAMRRLDEITPLIQPVADAAAGDPGNIAIVIPTGLMGLLPLAAVPVSGPPGQVLDDIGEIYLAPSAGVYGASRRRAPQSAQLRLVGVADPAGPRPLPAAGAELAAIRDTFPPGSQTACAFGANATREWVLAQIPGASHVHLACHGSSDLTGQAGGSLLLADDTRLTVADLTDGRLTGCPARHRQRLPVRALLHHRHPRGIHRAPGRIPPSRSRLRGRQPLAGPRRRNSTPDDPLLRAP